MVPPHSLKYVQSPYIIENSTLIKYRHCTYGIAGVPFLIKCGHCIRMVIVGVYTIFNYIWTLYVDVGVPVLIKYTLYGYIW